MHLADLERDLEISAIDGGIEAYKDNVEGRQPSELSPSRRYIAKGMDTLVPAIKKVQEEWLQGEPLVNSRLWGQFLCGLPAEKLALCTLSILYNYADADTSYTEVAGLVGRSAEQLRVFEEMRRGDNQYFHKALAHIPKMTPNRFRLMKRNYKFPMAKMPHNCVLSSGAKLLELAIEHTDMFEYRAYMSRGQRHTRIILHPAIREAIEEAHDDASLLTPLYRPMVIRPVDWTTETDGGYLLMETHAVRSSVPGGSTIPSASRDKQLAPLYRCLNTLQGTKWKIEEENLKLLSYIMESGGGRAGVPKVDRIKLIPRPADFETNHASKVAWLRDTTLIHKHNAKVVSKRRLIKSQIDIATLYLKLCNENPAVTGIYYVWDACFRYRVYPRATQLSPQASDTGRGLLTFAEGVPLGEHGYKWLSVGLANAIGEDKMSFAKRVAYVESRRKEITQWVSDPQVYTGWMEIDEPFQGLSLAREWVEAHEYEGGTENYVSHSVISMDGTCNGLQHFSAVGRDLAGGTYTNLLDAEDPDSVYNIVAEAAAEIVDADCRIMPRFDDDGDLTPCFAWKGNVDKGVTKTPTMTTYYGVTSFGIIEQLYEAVRKRGGLEGHSGKNMRYMLTTVQTAIHETVSSASDIMGWLRKVAVMCAAANKPITWYGPNGLPVTQDYPNFAERSIYTVFHRMYWRDPEQRDKKEPMSRAKNSNGLPPNFVHNLDATHMMMVLEKALAIGITQFRMIHDSFGVHAGHVESFRPLITEAFVELHRTNLLEKFAQDISQVLGKKLPPIPEQGQLNIEDVLKSTYLFC